MYYYGVGGEFGWVGLLAVCFHYKINPNPRKICAVGKSGPNATFNLIFLGLDWPWVFGSSSDSQYHLYVFQPNRQNLVNHKHRTVSVFSEKQNRRTFAPHSLVMSTLWLCRLRCCNPCSDKYASPLATSFQNETPGRER